MTKTDTLHIRVEPIVKKKAEKTLNELGISITEAVNVFLHQVILNDGIPFEIKKPRYNKETMEAIKETEKISKDKSVKGYTDIDELFEELKK